MSQNYPASFNPQGALTDFLSQVTDALDTVHTAFSGAARPTVAVGAGTLHYNETDGRLWANFGDRGWGPADWASPRIVDDAATVATADSSIFADTTSAGFALTLPEIDSGVSTDDLMDGRVFMIANIGANALEIAPDGSDEIEGSTASLFLRRQGDWIILCGDLNDPGTPNWRTLARGYAPGPLAVNVASAANATGSEETLRTFTLPAGMLDADGKGVEIEAIALMANNANAKQARLMMEAVELVTTGSLVLTDTGVTLRARVFRTGASAQRSIGFAGSDDGATLVAKTQTASGTEDTTGAIAFTLKATGVAADDVTAVLWRVTQI